MSDEVHLVNGAYQVETIGSASLTSRGDGVLVHAAGTKGNVLVTGESSVSLLASPATIQLVGGDCAEKGVIIAGGQDGSVTQFAGLPALGPRLQLKPDAITLEIGPPQVGASIKLTATEITLQIGTTKLSLTPTGITETLAAIKRELTPTGHELAAGPTSVQVQLTGVTEKGPMKQETFDAATTSKQALATESTDGVRTIKAGVLMLG